MSMKSFVSFLSRLFCCLYFYIFLFIVGFPGSMFILLWAVYDTALQEFKNITSFIIEYKRIHKNDHVSWGGVFYLK